MYVLVFFLSFLVADFLSQDGLPLEPKRGTVPLHRTGVQQAWIRAQDHPRIFEEAQRRLSERWKEMDARPSAAQFQNRVWASVVSFDADFFSKQFNADLSTEKSPLDHVHTLRFVKVHLFL